MSRIKATETAAPWKKPGGESLRIVNKVESARKVIRCCYHEFVSRGECRGATYEKSAIEVLGGLYCISMGNRTFAESLPAEQGQSLSVELNLH